MTKLDPCAPVPPEIAAEVREQPAEWVAQERVSAAQSVISTNWPVSADW